MTKISESLRNLDPAPTHHPEFMPVLLWLLARPADSPHAKVFATTAAYLTPNTMTPELLRDPQGRVLLEIALRHWDARIREKTLPLVRVAAGWNPTYKDLLPK
ncbi:MAG TPA: hypothetical protein VHO24_05125 [Opitutaceae bacterium]|nr:hypothetical protein [Opitutaceae bacterium]